MLVHDEYWDRVYGCWLGKNVGGTIGGPLEGRMEFLEVPEEYPEASIENDDLELQLVWLNLIREKGIHIDAKDLGKAWLRNLNYCWDEYGVAIANLRMGLQPPVTGFYNNWFKDSMGSPIRSEIWACLFPGQPERAAWYALQDAQVDHWGEGVYGEIYFAVLESMAFAGGEVPDLVERALAFIAGESRVYQVVELALSSWRRGVELRAARDAILEKFGHHNFTDCVQNIGFTILGLLHGNGEFLSSIVRASACGYDVDCTAATAGAVVGILQGGRAIVDRAGERLDQKLVIGWGVKDCRVPENVKELTDEVVALGEAAAGEADLPTLDPGFLLGSVPDFAPPMRIPFTVARAQGFDAATAASPAAGSGERNIVFDTAFLPLHNLFAELGCSAILLRTAFKVESARNLRLLPVSSGPVRLWLDSRLILDDPEPRPFLPATHRASVKVEPQKVETGVHEVKILVQRPKSGTLEFAWIVADEDQRKHWVTDLEYVVPEAAEIGQGD